MYQNCNKYFITIKHKQCVSEALPQYLPDNGITALQSGGVWLNKHRLLDPSHMLNPGDLLRVYSMSKQGHHYELPQTHIIHETPDWIIVYKPPGITTVPDRSNLFYNLSTGVETYFKSTHVHYHANPMGRLDFMVQGLVLYPKNKHTERHFAKALLQHKVGKVYLAIMPKLNKPPTFLRAKNKLHFTHKATPSDEKGKYAESFFIHRHTDANYSYYSVVLKTGRRHQIRHHAATFLNPLIGDTLYGSTIKTQHQEIGLLCYGYSFRHQVHHKIRLPQLNTYRQQLLQTIPLQ